MSANEKRQAKTYDLVYISVFAVIIAICSWISIPTAIPFTLQTLGIFLTVGILGGKRGTAAVFLYILLGVFGMPVFSGMTGGIGILMGMTGGYIIGFLFAALMMWGIEALFGRSRVILVLSMAIGLVVCYVIGTLWYMIVYTHNTGTIGLWTVLWWCVFPFIIPDLLKIAMALYLTSRFTKAVRQRG